MPPKRKCSCKGHDEYSAGKQFTVYKNDGKKMKRANVNILEKNLDLFTHSKFICNACCDYAQEHLQPPQQNINVSKCFDNIIEAIEGPNFTDDQLKQMAYVIGSKVRRDVQLDSLTCGQQYKDDAYLMAFQPKAWLSKRNSVLVKFVEGVSGADMDIAKNVLTVAKATEQLYFACSSSFVGPVSFCQTLMTHYITGSKGAIAIQGAGSAGGSYTSVATWTKKQSVQPLTCPKDADVVTFFDNNQVIQRKWRVESNFKSASSVITNIIHITPDPTLQLQRRLDLSPLNWLRVDKDSLSLFTAKLQQQRSEQNLNFKKYRDNFISGKIKEVFNQQGQDGSDHIDEVAAAGPIPQHTNDRYTFIPSGHTKEKTEVVMGEPCFENPCSYESVQKVLDHIKVLCGVGGDRQWTVVGCDGLPYTLGSRLLENIYKCTQCPREFEDEAEFLTHRQEFQHALHVNLSTCRKYNNIIMLPGLGHYEINMVKAMFKLLWQVCIVDLAKMLGFRSPKALAACESATDHHKSWQILQILLHAMAEELIAPYCNRCRQSNEVPTLAGYYAWSASVSVPNFIFMREAIFTYLLALHVFRAGVRRNNSAAITASKVKFAPLFFGLNMPFYMETFMRDSLVRIQCPPEISAFIEKHESYSVSGNDTKGEGGDFVLETKNRQTKHMIPPGVPTDATWLNVCRNVDRLAKIRKNTRTLLCLQDEADEDYSYNIDLSREIRDFRRIIRQKKYFGTEGRQDQHFSVSGVQLDQELVNFSLACKHNMSDFLVHLVENGLCTRKKYTPIFCTPEERSKYNDIANKSKSEILDIVNSYIDQLDEEEAMVYRKKLNKIKYQTKNAILAFLNEIKDLL